MGRPLHSQAEATAKVKLTLSIDEEIAGEADAAARERGMSLSELVEDLLTYVAAERWLAGISRRLGLSSQASTTLTCPLRGDPKATTLSRSSGS